MSSVLRAITTASGGCGGSQVVVCACCSRTACDVIRLLPKRAASASIALETAEGAGRVRAELEKATVARFVRKCRCGADRGKGCIAGQERRDMNQGLG